MKPRSLALPLCAILLLAGCQKKETQVAVAPPPPKPAVVELVPASERSRHFLAVSKQLELGGTLYGYADIDGDVLKMAGTLQKVMEEVARVQPQAAPYLKQDAAGLFKILGLDDVKAVGLSSVPDGTGFFRNRVFLYTPEKRHGLLAGLGGEPAPFARLHLAPANADIYSESEVDLAAVYQTVTEVVAKVGGEESAGKMEQALKMAGQRAAISLLDLVHSWKGHMAMVMRFEDGPGLRLPGPNPVQLPAFSLLISIDGIAPSVRDALVKLPMLSVRQEGNLEYFELKQPPPLPGLNPLVVLDGSTLMLATTPQFLKECLEAKGGLAQTAAFKQALAPFGDKANGLGYVSPRFFTRLHELEKMNPSLPAEPKRVLGLVLANLPQPDRPLVTVRTNLPDGILIRSYWNRSLKQDAAALVVYNPVTVGFLAAMAIPAFQKVRTASQEKAVMNNLRQLSAAADQYYLENGTSTARYDDLVGPDKYIKRINPVDGENYRTLVFKQGTPLRVMVPVLKKAVQYTP